MIAIHYILVTSFWNIGVSKITLSHEQCQYCQVILTLCMHTLVVCCPEWANDCVSLPPIRCNYCWCKNLNKKWRIMILILTIMYYKILYIYTYIQKQMNKQWYFDTWCINNWTPRQTITVPHTAWHNCITRSKPSLQLCSSHTLHIPALSNRLKHSGIHIWPTSASHRHITPRSKMHPQQ